ncbi:CHASE2 domain-containing protein [Desertibaculum subflavum]|uniref:CHASE2 domain-containing protein n=1 Tax=Desertibaculum subflavum TaxID=2268458 RepID=UPI000E663DA0
MAAGEADRAAQSIARRRWEHSPVERLPLRRWAQGLLFALLSLAYAAGLFERLEFTLMDLRFEMHQRPASDELVLVEIDTRSLRELAVWPWPREWHAEAIDALFAAGARRVAFDIDFSARSNRAADTRLATAIRAAEGRVILPVFHQRHSADSDDLVLTAPLPEFALPARLASVTVRPELDSRVRRMATTLEAAGETLPSLSATLADIGGQRPAGNYYIDYGIAAADIPRLSYVDVLNRKEALAGLVAGKSVLIGATAVELGDQLAAPVHLTLPGSVLLALGAETLAQGRALQRTGAVPTLAVAAALALLLGPCFGRWHWIRGLATVAGIQIVAIATGHVAYVALAVSLDVVPWLAMPLLSYVLAVIALIEIQARRILKQRVIEARHNVMMNAIVGSSFDAIVTADNAGRITHFNAAAERLFGLSAAQAIDRHVDTLLQLPDGGQLQTLLADGASLSTPIEVSGLRRDKTVFAGELALRRATLQRHRDLSVQGPDFDDAAFWLLTVRDITTRKAAEIAQAEATTAAEAANRAKTEFLATMSHELRTPLNAILGFSHIIREELIGSVGNPRYKEYAADINDSGTHLLEIINDILDTARIEAGKLKIHEEPIELPELLAAALRMASARPEGRTGTVPVRLTVDGATPTLSADRRLLKQILVNLVSNALKFTQSGEIVVSAGLAADGWLEVAVQDTGIGIAEADIPKVLQPFQQVDSSHARRYQGTGLGLSLVRSMMELHDGELRIDSKPGVGTKVMCRFPPGRLIPAGAAHSTAAKAAAA